MNTLSKEELIRAVKEIADAISPRWVLFENGTFVILRNDQQPDAIGFWAVEMLETYGIVAREDRPLLFEVKATNKGWLVTGDYWAIYTYVDPIEIKGDTTDLEKIGRHGMAKRNSDSVAPKIIFLQDEL